MERLKVSEGKCWVYKHPECLQLRVGDGLGFIIGELYENASKRVKMDEAIANATLFSDSINTYQKCCMLPSELLEKLNQANMTIQKMSGWVDIP